MHQGKLVFAQLMLCLPLSTFRRCVADHDGEHKVKDFSCLDPFFAMAFAQLACRGSLRDIEVNLRAQHCDARQEQHQVQAALLAPTGPGQHEWSRTTLENGCYF